MIAYKKSSFDKIPEALGAIIDERVIMHENTNEADVFSSNRTKQYYVEWDGNIYASNDNVSYWQGYAGYPIIAVILMQEKIPYDKSILEYFKGIEWKKINTKYKNDYRKTLEEIYQGLTVRGVDTKKIDEEIENIYKAFCEMNITVKRGSKFPPK